MCPDSVLFSTPQLISSSTVCLVQVSRIGVPIYLYYTESRTFFSRSFTPSKRYNLISPLSEITPLQKGLKSEP
jgi:hypothetical protein